MGSNLENGNFRNSKFFLRRFLSIFIVDPLRNICNTSLSAVFEIKNQIFSSRKALSCDFVKAPTFVASILPFLKSINVGIPLTP